MQKPITIAIANNKGGAGKTTSTLHIAHTLCGLGYSVTTLDLDGQANLTDALLGGKANRPMINLGHVLSDGVDLRAALYPAHTSASPEGTGVLFCGASDGNLDDTNDDLVIKPLGVMRLRTALSTLPVRHNFTLIDCPPNLGALTYSALIASDYVLIPTKPEAWSINGVQRVIEKIGEVHAMLGSGPSLLGVIATQRRATVEHDHGLATLSAPGQPPILGVVPQRGGVDGSYELHVAYRDITHNLLAQLEAAQ